jgi:hypothetical protein
MFGQLYKRENLSDITLFSNKKKRILSFSNWYNQFKTF